MEILDSSYTIRTEDGRVYDRDEEEDKIFWGFYPDGGRYCGVDSALAEMLEQEFQKTYSLIKHGPISSGPDISLEEEVLSSENLGDEALPLSRGGEDVGC